MTTPVTTSPGTWLPVVDARTEALARVLEAHRVGLEKAEASVRHESGRITGGRMMLDHADAAVAPALAQALSCGHERELERFEAAALGMNAILIAGWDVSGARAVTKLYADASDLAPEVRRRLAAKLGLSRWLGEYGDPHVIGLNVSADGFEIKAYAQAADPYALLGPLPSLRPLVDAFLPVCAGAVLSRDVTPHGTPARAYFVAFRAGLLEAADGVCRKLLPGYSPETIEAALPFAPAPVRTVGLAASGVERWTAYFKPRDAPGEVPTQLDPIVTLRCSGGEAGLHLEHDPSSSREKVAYRVRAGTIPGPAAERLLAWAEAVVARVRASGRVPVAGDFVEPPSPWTRVDGR